MSLLLTEETKARNSLNQFNKELQYMLETDTLKQGLARLVLIGEDYTLEDEFQVARELENISEEKANATVQEVLKEVAEAPMPNLNNIDSLEQATARINALTKQLNQKIREQEDAVASKKGWYATIILNLKRAITWIKEKISAGYYKAKNKITGVFNKDKQLQNAKNDWKRANNQYNNAIQRL